jgi:hypothetical protein
MNEPNRLLSTEQQKHVQAYIAGRGLELEETLPQVEIDVLIKVNYMTSGGYPFTSQENTIIDTALNSCM